MAIEKIHHVAYRCNNAKETVEWYETNLGMNFVLAIAEDKVPSTKADDPYMHVFLDAGGGNILAFFELPTQPDMGRDENTPVWTQHLALQVKDRDELLNHKQRLQDRGISVLGPTDHSIFHSIYFFDPNGHRLELTYPDSKSDEIVARLDGVKWAMLNEWNETKKAPKHADWLHTKALN
jgi:catechol 2,3-dioxygenase-like lactoylglutathione lyase family enzyme